MMDYPLTVQYIFQRAVRYFPNRELVTVTADGAERSTYGDLAHGWHGWPARWQSWG